MIAYGVFLILIGVIGFLSNPEKAATALISGGLFGSLSIGLGLVAARGWRKARGVGLGLGVFLAVVFLWRSTMSWLAVAGGQSEKLVAAILITLMLAASVCLVWSLRGMGQKVPPAGLE
jgi:hypothetical protein